RGHTAWLTAAVDERVKGIIPIAIDVLNAKEQLPHHLTTFGHYSTPSVQATAFLKELKQPRGKDLIRLIDPYGYKRVLQITALIVCATNDEFFPTDALNLYWEGLKGPKSVLYLSNAGHVRADSDPRINPAAFAFVRAIAMEKTLPAFTWRLQQSAKKVQLIIHADTSTVKASIWRASSQSRDFRQSQWRVSPLTATTNGSIKQFEAAVQYPASGFVAFYAELTFTCDGHTFSLSTQTSIQGSK
ncbi:MAG TPA: PhoPQ-activated protein PqaA family protein, partial [Chitinophagaceae bacterium]|nr:PhoPQ-activated protein PqaA family protein [Chitinophagaceae bacterium]